MRLGIISCWGCASMWGRLHSHQISLTRTKTNIDLVHEWFHLQRALPIHGLTHRGHCPIDGPIHGWPHLQRGPAHIWSHPQRGPLMDGPTHGLVQSTGSWNNFSEPLLGTLEIVAMGVRVQAVRSLLGSLAPSSGSWGQMPRD